MLVAPDAGEGADDAAGPRVHNRDAEKISGQDGNGGGEGVEHVRRQGLDAALSDDGVLSRADRTKDVELEALARSRTGLVAERGEGAVRRDRIDGRGAADVLNAGE